MKSARSIILLTLLGLLFGAGVYRLFQLRFESGDVYPPYSSLRADPLGTMALFEGLNRMPSLEAQRDFSPENRLPEGRATAYLHLAARSLDWSLLPEDLFVQIEAFVIQGGRLVIAFRPEPVKPISIRGTPPTAGPPATKPGQPPSRRKKTTTPEEGPRTISLENRWGVALHHVPLKLGDGDTYEPVAVENVSALPLPEVLDWHSGLVLTNVHRPWQTVYARDSNPVVVERKWGAGSIVIATDSYLLSNEALSQEAHADLLAWLVSPARVIYFDEAHLGLIEAPSVTGLIRQYRLHGVMAALLLLAGLFIWKNSIPFVPPYSLKLPPGYVEGKDNSAGFLNLLRRNLAPADLLKTCFDEWTKSLTQGNPHLIARVDRAQELLEQDRARLARERQPVKVYREIAQALKSRF